MKVGYKVQFVKVKAFNPDAKDILPEKYRNEGFLMDDVLIGFPIRMSRIKRNDIEALGLFTTSPVKKIENDLIHTQNSVWKIKILEKTK